MEILQSKKSTEERRLAQIPRIDQNVTTAFWSLACISSCVVDVVLRFFAGGCLVCLFAVIGEVLEPKSFAGLFGAAPSIALASLSLTIATKGTHYAALECRSMAIGAVAFGLYAAAVTWLLARRRVSAFTAAFGGLSLWFVLALGLWAVLLH